MTEIGTILVVLWLLLKRDGRPKGPTFTGEFVPPSPGEPTTPLEVWKGFIADEPTVQRGYRVKKGEVFYGANGIVARALAKAYGRPATVQERVSYYRAMGRVRSNWRTTGTLRGPGTGEVEAFTIRNADGATVEGTMEAALEPVNDSWALALAQGHLPRRLIQWGRTQSGHAAPRSDWKELASSLNRTYGCVWLPPLSAMDAGEDVTWSPEYDWPTALYHSVGTTWEEWVP